MSYTQSVKTIPYSQFKNDLAAGKVVKAEIHDNEIDGEILSNSPPAEEKTKETNGEAKASAAAKVAAAAKPSDEAKTPGGSAKSATSSVKPAASLAERNSTDTAATPPDATSASRTPKTSSGATQSSAATAKAAKQAFAFRTITGGVDADPELIKELDRAK